MKDVSLDIFYNITKKLTIKEDVSEVLKLKNGDKRKITPQKCGVISE